MHGNRIRVAPVVLLLLVVSCASPLHIYPGSKLPSSATAKIEIYRSTQWFADHPGDIGYAEIDGTTVGAMQRGVAYVLPGRHVFTGFLMGETVSTGMSSYGRTLTKATCTMEFEAIAGKTYSYVAKEKRGALVDKETDAEVASCVVTPA